MTQAERTVCAILDLVVNALRAQKNDYPTLEQMKDYCGQACKMVAALRKPPPGD